MADEAKPQSWWQTLPGVITQITALLTAILGLFGILNQFAPIVHVLPTTGSKSTTIPQPVVSATPASVYTPSPADESVTELELIDFVNRYLAAQNGGDVPTLLDLYDSHVDYFASGVVVKNVILEDKQKYYQHWQVRYALVGEISVRDGTNAGEKLVTFKVNYLVHNLDRAVNRHGIATDILTIRRVNDDLKIVGENQVFS